MSVSIETYHLDGIERMLRAKKIKSITFSDILSVRVRVEYTNGNVEYFGCIKHIFTQE